MGNKKLILATTSPHRIKAFQMLDIPFEAKGSEVDEYYDGRPGDPQALVLHLAELKAKAVAQNEREKCIVMGFDSVGFFNGKILEKPQSRSEAETRLVDISGGIYSFFTGICLICVADGGQYEKIISNSVKTTALMRDFSMFEVLKYFEQDQSYKTYAQGFDPLQTYGATFINEIFGSYNNILRGMPLEAVVEMLQNVGYLI